ncbi:leucine-rich repeat-containing protein 4C [Xyrauchen texanus]|uniref:leucine-rich repeat-containing protein 4C n=1 Tax=Xyrauchen texanus TaxID=154827 RepID=UPI002241AFCC|nr:leucine-rich repeat-containing protein 4C [Xyrauchen texanus]XP_051947365.1 leucine-rich repeat-containing protein 4C [Xyrauchen texanus]
MGSIITLLFFMMQFCVVMSNICQSDRNQDHRPRVSCVSQGLTAVPEGIDPLTQVLVLTKNRFSSLSWSAYSGFTHLHELDLSFNQISVLEPPGPVLKNLSVLNLSGNRLAGLGGKVFSCAPSLMEIYLNENELRSLHDATFSELPQLEIIELSRNKLPALPSRLLQRMSSVSLKKFDLENNSLSIMPDGFFSFKPDIAYVYLSHNPWLCSCAVDYLHSYLNDQDHNIYIHVVSNIFTPGAETVVCAKPPHLKGQSIIELEKDVFCPQDPTNPPPLYNRGDIGSWLTESDISFDTEPTTAQPHTTTAPITARTELSTIGPITARTELSTIGPITARTELSTTGPITARTELSTTGPITARTELSTTGPITARTELSTIGPITARTELSTTGPITARTELSTIGPITARTELSTTGPITAQLQTTTGPITAPPKRSTTTQTTSLANWTEGKDAWMVNGRMLPWCWWLFARFVVLCVLSALTSSFLFLWLLKNYLGVYCRLKRHTSTYSDCKGVTLQAYRRTENTSAQGEDNKGERVTFLSLKQIKDVQAVFRSVLYISKEDERDDGHGMRDMHGGGTKGRDVSTKIELVSIAEEERDKQREDAAQMMRGDVFRKALYRVISQEEETDGWVEEEESWRTTRDQRTARYSLILREESEERGNEWVVGEWQMGERGVAYERACTLIGQVEH